MTYRGGSVGRARIRARIEGIAGAALLAAGATWIPACGSSSSDDEEQPHCLGAPLPCAATPQALCDSTPGCHASGTCDGFSTQGVCSLDVTFSLCIGDLRS